MTGTENADNMTAAEFNAAKAAQNNKLRNQVSNIGKLSPSQRETFQVLTVHCQKCSTLFLEILDTEDYPVVCYRRTEPHPIAAGLPSDTDPADRAHILANLPQSYRPGPWQFFPLPKPIPRPSGDGVEKVRAACRCKEHHLTMDKMLGFVEAGKRNAVV